MNPITLFLFVVCVLIGALTTELVGPFAGAPFILLAVIVAASLKMANVWQRFVVLRAGKLQGVKGPGLFLIVPILDWSSR